VEREEPAVLAPLGRELWPHPVCHDPAPSLWMLGWDGVARQFHAGAEAICLPALTDEKGPATAGQTSAAVAAPSWQGFTIDGKTLRGSLAPGVEAAQVISVVAHDSGVNGRKGGVREMGGEPTLAPAFLASVSGRDRNSNRAFLLISCIILGSTTQNVLSSGKAWTTRQLGCQSPGSKRRIRRCRC
jgi:hypothetical protein